MKKNLLLGAFLVGSLFSANSQVLFEEDWDGNGPGISGWTLYNVDNNTPEPQDPLSVLITDAWNVLSLTDIQTALQAPAFEYPPAATGMAGNVAVSNSYYNPLAAANDWLVSPAITIPDGATEVNLQWAANSLGNDTFLEEYEVLISTTTSEIASFDLLLDVENESNDGNYRTVSLDSYAGQTVYIAFRNNSNDQYVMLLDNITVTEGALSVKNYLASQFSVYPNPATDVINISNADNILVNNVSVTDLNGRTVKSLNLDGVTETQINISDLAAGVYMMNVSSDRGNMTKKIVKN